MYPAMRDAKAAVRWIRANAEHYNLSPEHITAIGGSAGACSVVGLASTFEGDYKHVRLRLQHTCICCLTVYNLLHRN